MTPSRPPHNASATDATRVRVRRLEARHYVWVGVAALALVLLLHWLGPILTPFLVGAILAYVGRPAVDWAAAHGVPRTLGTLLVILFMAIILMALVLLITPLVQTEISVLVRRLPDAAAILNQRLVPWVNDTLGVNIHFDLASIREFVSENLESAQSLSLKMLAGLKTGSTLVLALLINLALIPVVMFYLLRDWNMIILRIADLTPRRWLPKVVVMTNEIDDVLAEFLRGQLSVMIVLGAYYAVALSIAGLQFAVPIGILTGALVFIPYVGFGLGLVLGVLAALLQWTGWAGFTAVLAVYAMGQLLENYLLVPWLVGDRIGLHPLAVIFALLAFGQLFGFAGVLLALPVSAALLVALRHLRGAYLLSPLYR